MSEIVSRGALCGLNLILTAANVRHSNSRLKWKQSVEHITRKFENPISETFKAEASECRVLDNRTLSELGRERDEQIICLRMTNVHFSTRLVLKQS